jgi:non-specific serine/threonine protein kinase
MWLERALELGTRDRRERARAETALGRILIAQGHHAAAVPPLRAAVPAARADGDPDLLADALAMLGLALATAEPAEAMQLLDEAMERAAGARARAGALLCRGVAALHAGNPRLARELIARCAAICTAAGDRLLLGTAYGSTVLEALSSGDVERAGACAREGVLNYQELHDTVGLAMALESLAWTATAARDYRRAARLLGACDRESAEVGGNPLRSARFAEEHGDCVATVTRRLGPETFGAERRRGAALSTAALVRFALAPDHAPTAGRPRRSRAGPPGGGPLTRREQQVAGLVAQGLSNRQIAAKLVISTRTAEGHVENILIKLGFASRAQVAVWHAERCG